MGRSNQPAAVKTSLGWTLTGSIAAAVPSSLRHVLFLSQQAQPNQPAGQPLQQLPRRPANRAVVAVKDSHLSQVIRHQREQSRGCPGPETPDSLSRRRRRRTGFGTHRALSELPARLGQGQPPRRASVAAVRARRQMSTASSSASGIAGGAGRRSASTPVAGRPIGRRRHPAQPATAAPAVRAPVREKLAPVASAAGGPEDNAGTQRGQQQRLFSRGRQQAKGCRPGQSGARQPCRACLADRTHGKLPAAREPCC